MRESHSVPTSHTTAHRWVAVYRQRNEVLCRPLGHAVRNRQRSEQGRLAQAVRSASLALDEIAYLARSVAHDRMHSTDGTTAPTPAPTSGRSTPGSSSALSAPSPSASTANPPLPPLSPNGSPRSPAPSQAQTSTAQAAWSKKSGTRACRRIGRSCWARGSRWRRAQQRLACSSRSPSTRRTCRTRSSSSWCVRFHRLLLPLRTLIAMSAT